MIGPGITDGESGRLFIAGLVGVLVTSSVAALIFQRLRLALIPAYLIAGVLVGPSGLGLVQSSEALKDIGHLAVVLLLFGVGMELHLTAFRRSAVTLIGSSVAACVLCVAIGFPIVRLFGLPTPQALVVAMAFSLSSTALVLRLLTVSRELVRAHGQLSLAILVTQDLAVLFMLAGIPALATWGGGGGESVSQAPMSVSSTIVAALGLVALVVGGQKILPRLLAESLHGRSSEVLMLSSITAALLAAYITESMGFSLEMGAFLVGFLLASSPFRYQLAGQIAPLRDLFMAVFFTTLGMEVNLDIVLASLPVILAGTACLVFAKAGIITLAAWLFGAQPRMAILCGVMLSQAGEFSLIIFGSAAQLRLFAADEVSVLIAIVVFSLVITPTLFSLAGAVAERARNLPSAPWFRGKSLLLDEDTVLDATGERVIVAGYGPVGRGVCALLAETGTPFTVVELNRRTVSEGKAAGVNIVFGDVTNDSVLRAIRLEGARAFILTFPDAQRAKEAAAKARLIHPTIEIVARAPSADDGARLRASDIDDVVIDEEESVRRMVELAQRLTRGARDEGD